MEPDNHPDAHSTSDQGTLLVNHLSGRLPIPRGRMNRPYILSTTPRVSVVMAAYNEEKHITGAMDSILQQSLTDFEFIVVDDGSTDSTVKILRSYTDPRIRLVLQTHLGLTPSLNNGLSLARGHYIARMDGGDISYPERLQVQVEFLERNQHVGLVGAYCLQIDHTGTSIKLYRYETDDADIKKALWSDCPFCHPVVMFRRGCIDSVGGYRERIGPAEDYDLWFRISERFQVANIPRPLLLWRIVPTGITLSNRFTQIRSFLLVRHLAQEREQGGLDGLDRFTDQEFEQLLERLLPRTPANLRRVSHSTGLFLCEVFYCTGNYLSAAKQLLKTIPQRPLVLRNWVLALKLIVCFVLPRRVLPHVKTLYRRITVSQARSL